MNATLEMVAVIKSVKTHQAITSAIAILDTSWPVMEGVALTVNNTTNWLPIVIDVSFTHSPPDINFDPTIYLMHNFL